MELEAFQRLRADNETPFADRANLAKFKFLMAEDFVNDKYEKTANRERLPIGFAIDEDENRVKYVGLTCAACHTAAIKIGKNGPRCLVEGAPTMVDFEGFLKALDQAIGNDQSPPAQYTKRLLKFYLEPKRLNGPEYGFGRVDALGQIHNRLIKPKAKGNVKLPADAPVSYPHLWNTPSLSHVQWTAVASNEGRFGPLSRNVGEALGVFGQLDILRIGTVTPSRSSINVRNLERIEKWLETLEAPRWPEQFGVIDKSSPEFLRGQQLYKDNCAMCHKAWEKPKTGLFPVSIHKLGHQELGTGGSGDPLTPDDKKRIEKMSKSPIDTEWHMAVRSAKRAGDKGFLEDDLFEKKGLLNALSPLVSLTKAFKPPLNGSVLLVKAVGLTIAGTRGVDESIDPTTVFTAADRFGKTFMSNLEPQYRARPLNGIWATAPYLHNGSVPTLRDLLNPMKDRPPSFQVGCSEYDPDSLGFKRMCHGESTFTFNTNVIGNGNQGHLWGTNLSEGDKKALIQYLKQL